MFGVLLVAVPQNRHSKIADLWDLDTNTQLNLWGLDKFVRINLWGLEFCITFAASK